MTRLTSKNPYLRVLLILSLLLLLPILGFAQGNITGVVTDSTQAVVPDVEISITHTATNVSMTARSGPTGVYTLMRVPVGTYTFVAKKEGFRGYQQAQIPVLEGDTLRLDITLQVGQVAETVTVTGAPPLVQSENAQVGMTITSSQFTELPLTLGGGIRNPSSFIFLQPGVTPGSTWTKSINGVSSFTDQVYYEGISLSRGDTANDGEVNPSVDAIAEFKLISNNYTAEYTHALGGVTTFNMKSGTNALHGSGFWLNSVEAYNARNFFQASKPMYRQNNWGFTVGGPILFPKVYNGRNKSFFFFSLDQFYLRAPGSPGLGTVPTSKMLTGDFSEWVAAGNGMVYNPRTARTVNGTVVRDPFPNNIIPKSMWSRISTQLAAMQPEPTYSGLTSNYQLQSGSPTTDQRSSGFKIDHMFTEAHRLSGMFNYTDRPAVKCPSHNNSGSASLAGDLECHNVQRVTTRIVRLNYDWMISPTVLNRFSAGLSRFRNPNFSVGYDKGWVDKLGLTGVGGDLFPWVDFNHDYAGYGDTIASDNYYTNFTFLDTVSIMRSNHTIKIGAEVQRHRNNFRDYGSSGGNWQFNQLSTGLPGVSKSGNSFASFLLGDVYSASCWFPYLQYGNRNGYYSPWVNDDWKVTPRLTLNLGLRWEIQPPFTDPNNRLAYMDPTATNAALGGISGAYVFASKGAFSNTGNTHWKDFAPRFGFAYRVTDKTVVRGGFGVFYAQVMTAGTGVNGLREGYNISASFSSADLGVTPAMNWDNGFRQDFAHPPQLIADLKNAQSATWVDRDRSTLVSYTEQFNLIIERQVGQSMSFTAGYVGNLGRRLSSGINWNQTDPKYLSLGSLLSKNILDPAVVAAGFKEPFAGFATLWGSRGTLAQALKRWPQFTSVGQAGAFFGSSNYHSLQVSGIRRMSKGLMFTMAYTFSKSINDTNVYGYGAGSMDYSNRKLDRSIASLDQPHTLSFSYIYELPFGPGQKHLTKGIASKALGGWKITGMQIYASGTPLGFTINNNLPIGNAGQRPDIVSSNMRSSVSADAFDPAKDLWLNAAAFAVPAAYTFGNAPRNTGGVRGPMFMNENIGLLKDTKWGERFNWQFRFESTNPFNRVVFSSPVTNFSSGSFGRITSAGGSRRLTLGTKFYF